MSISLKALQTAAKELNNLEDFLEEKIDVKSDEETLTQLIVEAIDLIEEDDNFTFTKATQAIFDILSAPAEPAAKAAPAKKGSKKVEEPAEEPEEEEEAPEAEEAPEEESELVVEIKATKKVKELLEIVAEEKAFKTSAKKLNAIKNVDTLRDAMLAILAPAPEEKPVAKKEAAKKEAAKKEPKASAKKEVKKEAPVKEKKVPVAKVKKERAANRQDSVVKAINELCKKGATLKEVMNLSDKLYVAEGGESNPTATNVNAYTMNALLAFDVLTKDEKGYYKFQK